MVTVAILLKINNTLQTILNQASTKTRAKPWFYGIYGKYYTIKKPG
jgi:hypothetical protein